MVDRITFEHDAKVNRLYARARERGICKANLLPPLTRLFWRLGFDVPPFCFWQFKTLALMFSVIWSAGFSLLMFWVSVPGAQTRWPLLLAVVELGGLLFGTTMARYHVNLRKRLSFSDWDLV